MVRIWRDSGRYKRGVAAGLAGIKRFLIREKRFED